MQHIRIDVGVYTALEIDLSGFDFTGVKKLVMTAKNAPVETSAVIFEREYTEPKVYTEYITPEESVKLVDGAVYDFNKVLVDGKRLKMGDNGKIELRRGCGR
jgi:L-lactate utilization protein LutB